MTFYNTKLAFFIKTYCLPPFQFWNRFQMLIFGVGVVLILVGILAHLAGNQDERSSDIVYI